MATHVITIVVQADEPDFADAVEAAVSSLQGSGFTPTEVRVSGDEGEQVVPIEPPAEEETPPEEPPAEEPTTDEPLTFTEGQTNA